MRRVMLGVLVAGFYLVELVGLPGTILAAAVLNLVVAAATGVVLITVAILSAFVYGIVISLFVFFNIFALVQWLQYKRVGRWASYRYGERAYLVLSLAAKSALAWQVFGGTLAG